MNISVNGRVAAPKRAGRKDREHRVLISLVEHYLQTGKPVGSHSLQESDCSDISSATIRNYFVSLEQAGYLKQQHTSGGRIPLSKAFAEYAKFCLDKVEKEKPSSEHLLDLQEELGTNNVILMLQQTAEALSQKAKSAVAISAPRFDHDTVAELRFVFVDVQRVLALIMTEFGLVHTYLISCHFPVTHTLLKKADHFARSRLFQEELEQTLFEEGDLDFVRMLYQEAIASYFVSYSNVSQEDVWKTGFSRLLHCSDLDDTETLSSSFALFENTNALRGHMREAMRAGKIKVWIGEDLFSHLTGEASCALMAVPYFVGSRAVGALLVVSSMRLFYSEMFRLLRDASEQLSTLLTKTLMHHRISYRSPESHAVLTKEAQELVLDVSKKPQLEHKQEAYGRRRRKRA